MYNSIKKYQIPRTKSNKRCLKSLHKLILKLIWKHKWPISQGNNVEEKQIAEFTLLYMQRRINK